jgi:ABC-type multidrug transport system fused ATPase/permease subunit
VEFGHPPLHDSYNSFSGGAKALKGVTVLEGRNVVATYSPSLPPALKGVSFELKAGELVGFVGRTGSGKSTLSWVLARAMPIAEGSLLLQGTEVGTVPLKQYRDLVHIYPQDSFIFSGKLRLFLDPHGFHSDAKLNDLLDEFVKATASSSSEQRGGTSDHLLELDHAITAGGGNLSSGQKQVCTLVRAALSDAAVVVLDEVTSSMDMTSSTKAIEILQRELVRKDAAVLLVSHRPEDLVSCNAIWRMDAGTLSLEK